MKKQKIFLIAILHMALLNSSMSCSKDSKPQDNINPPPSGVSGEWLIPANEVFEGGPGRCK